jgi:integrase
MDAQGKFHFRDSCKVWFQKLQEKTGIKKGLKTFRKTSATMLKSDPRYRSLVDYFLGHAPKSIADRHYGAESQTLFNEAVSWLGEQFFGCGPR